METNSFQPTGFNVSHMTRPSLDKTPGDLPLSPAWLTGRTAAGAAGMSSGDLASGAKVPDDKWGPRGIANAVDERTNAPSDKWAGGADSLDPRNQNYFPPPRGATEAPAPVRSRWDEKPENRPRENSRWGDEAHTMPWAEGAARPAGNNDERWSAHRVNRAARQPSGGTPAVGEKWGDRTERGPKTLQEGAEDKSKPFYKGTVDGAQGWRAKGETNWRNPPEPSAGLFNAGAPERGFGVGRGRPQPGGGGTANPNPPAPGSYVSQSSAHDRKQYTKGAMESVLQEITTGAPKLPTPANSLRNELTRSLWEESQSESAPTNADATPTASDPPSTTTTNNGPSQALAPPPGFAPPSRLLELERFGIDNALAALARDQWRYRDPQGQVQGPFARHEIWDWYHNNYLPPNLPVQATPPVHNEQQFYSLKQLLTLWAQMDVMEVTQASIIEHITTSQHEQNVRAMMMANQQAAQNAARDRQLAAQAQAQQPGMQAQALQPRPQQQQQQQQQQSHRNNLVGLALPGNLNLAAAPSDTEEDDINSIIDPYPVHHAKKHVPDPNAHLPQGGSHHYAVNGLQHELQTMGLAPGAPQATQQQQPQQQPQHAPHDPWAGNVASAYMTQAKAQQQRLALMQAHEAAQRAQQESDHSLLRKQQAQGSFPNAVQADWGQQAPLVQQAQPQPTLQQPSQQQSMQRDPWSSNTPVTDDHTVAHNQLPQQQPQQTQNVGAQLRQWGVPVATTTATSHVVSLGEIQMEEKNMLARKRAAQDATVTPTDGSGGNPRGQSTLGDLLGQFGAQADASSAWGTKPAQPVNFSEMMHEEEETAADLEGGSYGAAPSYDPRQHTVHQPSGWTVQPNNPAALRAIQEDHLRSGSNAPSSHQDSLPSQVPQQGQGAMQPDSGFWDFAAGARKAGQGSQGAIGQRQPPPPPPRGVVSSAVRSTPPSQQATRQPQNQWQNAPTSTQRGGVYTAAAKHTPPPPAATRAAPQAPHVQAANDDLDAQTRAAIAESLLTKDAPMDHVVLQNNPDFKAWCVSKMTELGGTMDLIAFLLGLDANWEIQETAQTYLGTKAPVGSFVAEFIRRKNQAAVTKGNPKRKKKNKNAQAAHVAPQATNSNVASKQQAVEGFDNDGDGWAMAGGNAAAKKNKKKAPQATTAVPTTVNIFQHLPHNS